MKLNKSVFFIFMIIALFSIAGVCAGDVNEMIMESGSEMPIETCVSDEFETETENPTEISKKDELMSAGASEDTLGVSNEDVLGATVWYVNASAPDGGTQYKDFKSVLENRLLKDGDTVYFAGGNTYRGNRNVGLTFDKDLTLLKDGDGEAIFDAEHQSTIFTVDGTITINGLTFMNGKGEYGGAIDAVFGTLTNCNFINNNAPGKTSWGGAVRMRSSGIFTNCSFTGNQAAFGGAIAMNYGDVTNCNFTNNIATRFGGAINSGLDDMDATIKNCNFVNNKAYDRGGAIYQYHVNVINSVFSDNTSPLGNNVYGVYSGTADSCIFKTVNNPVQTNILSPTFSVDDCIIIDGLGDKLTFNLKTNGGEPITNRNISIKIYQNGASVRTVNCLSGGWDVDLPIGTYIVECRASDYGLGPVNATLKVVPPTFLALNDEINGNGNNMVVLKNDFYFDSAYDQNFINGVVISKDNCIIDGQNCTIDAKGKARIFYITGNNVTVKNLNLINGYRNDGGAIYFIKPGNVDNCNFTGNSAKNGGAVNFLKIGEVTNCNFINNNATTFGGAIYFTDGNCDLMNCNFTGNDAVRYGGAVYFNKEGNVENCNFNDNTAFYGGALRMNSGTVENCKFINNKATGDKSYGGAIYFNEEGNVTDCSFVNSTAEGGYGGAVRMKSGTVDNCNFTDNRAKYDGGAVWITKGSLKNCNFTRNKATGSESEGGAVYFDAISNVINCNFDGNAAFNGGAIRMSSGTVENCNFTGNTATNNGGAVYFANQGSVTSCTFKSNEAKLNGGAVSFNSNGDVLNCNFTANKATDSSSNGGAVFMKSGNVDNCNFAGNTAVNGGAVQMSSGTVENCIFTGNNANGDGGAVRMSSGTVENCSFTDNQVTGASSYGGAIYIGSQGHVTNCNFTNNAAKEGGAVYSYIPSNYVSNYYQSHISNCNFANNTATNGDGGAVYNPRTVTNCNFTGNTANNTGGAIRMSSGTVENCNFTANNATGNHGGAIWISSGAVSNCNFAGNTARYRGGAVCFDTQGSVSNCNFDKNTASYRGGAVSFDNQGNLTNCNFTGNNATFYGGAVYFRDDGNVTDCNFINNQATGNQNSGGALCFNKKGNVRNSNFTNNQLTGSLGMGGAVYLKQGTLTNCSFERNSATSDGSYGGAVYFETPFTGTVINCNFEGNTAAFGGAIRLYSGNVTDCNFTGNTARDVGGAVFLQTPVNVRNCNFINNSANTLGGAVYFMKQGNLTDCNFTNNSAVNNGGAVYFNEYGNVGNCNFVENKATFSDGFSGKSGGAVYFNKKGSIRNSNFTNNSATDNGGAVYFNEYGNVGNCNFAGNKISAAFSFYKCGGAVYFNDEGNAENCNFTGNEAWMSGAVHFNKNGNAENCNFAANIANWLGGAVYFVGQGNVASCSFNDNRVWYGGAVYFNGTGNASNCNFTNNSAGDNGGAVYFSGPGNVENCNFANNRAANMGSAIYLAGEVSISNSAFKNNKAGSLMNADMQQNLVITFKGNDNYINAIYAESDDLTFENVTYWWNATELNTDNYSPAKDTFPGFDIAVEIYAQNGDLIENMTLKTSQDGSVEYSPFHLRDGEYSYVAYHNEDDYYAYSKVNATLTLARNQTAVKINIDNMAEVYYNSRIDFDVINATTVRVIITSANGTVILNETTAENFAVAGELPGDGYYNITVINEGDKSYAPSMDSKMFKIIKFVSSITIRPIPETHYGDIINVEVSGTNLDIINVTVYDSQNNVVFTKEDLKATVELPVLAVGNYTIIAINRENATVCESRNSTVFTVLGLMIDAADVKYGEGTITYSARLLDEKNAAVSNRTLIFAFDGKAYNATTDAEGIAKITLNIKEGTYDVNVTYLDINVTRKITVIPRITPQNLVMDYLGANYQVQIVGADGNIIIGETVKMTVNGVTYNVVTDANGFATLKINLRPDTFTITTTYGDITIKNTIKVNPTLKVKKTFRIKRNSKKLVLKATLKWSSGKPIISQKVTFKFRGKTYTVKTNKKGIAKVVIKKKILKKLKRGKTYKVGLRHVNETATSKVKVKK